MKYRNTQQYEYVNKLKRDYIKEHLFECYRKLCKGEDIDNLIKSHKKIICDMELIGKNKNKYKTVNCLEHYRNTKNKICAMMILTNTLNRAGGLKLNS